MRCGSLGSPPQAPAAAAGTARVSCSEGGVAAVGRGPAGVCRAAPLLGTASSLAEAPTFCLPCTLPLNQVGGSRRKRPAAWVRAWASTTRRRAHPLARPGQPWSTLAAWAAWAAAWAASASQVRGLALGADSPSAQSRLQQGRRSQGACAVPAPRPPPAAGLGFGLPLSRLYARYFGGDLRLVNMPGWVGRQGAGWAGIAASLRTPLAARDCPLLARSSPHLTPQPHPTAGTAWIPSSP